METSATFPHFYPDFGSPNHPRQGRSHFQGRDHSVSCLMPSCHFPSIQIYSFYTQITHEITGGDYFLRLNLTDPSDTSLESVVELKNIVDQMPYERNPIESEVETVGWINRKFLKRH